MTRLRNRVGASAGPWLLCVLLSGCLHTQKVPPLSQQAKTPNIYVPPPAPENLPPMEAEPPADVTDAKPVVAEEVKPKKRVRKPPAVIAPTTPVATAPVEAPPATPVSAAVPDATLGALGSGEDASPSQQKDVAAKIESVEKRLTGLPVNVQDHEQKQIAKVRLFSKEASDALKGGDVDGARILATKAELLLDDLTK